VETKTQDLSRRITNINKKICRADSVAFITETRQRSTRSCNAAYIIGTELPLTDLILALPLTLKLNPNSKAQKRFRDNEMTSFFGQVSGYGLVHQKRQITYWVGWRASDRILFLWLVRTARVLPAAKSQSRTVQSWEAVITLNNRQLCTRNI